MTIELAKPIADYFATDSADGDAIARCFTDNAVVTDEGHTHRGVASIKRWRAEVSKEFTYASEPFASEVKEDKTIVTSRVVGNFPGSPVDLRYFFGLEGDKIASLEITAR